ncbi:hypothetical protein [Alkalicoccus urumqiensis]|uniref:DUF4352 domain-containing protein n=1 Tax=Alkalicoccus urumqiensis TaxID=1548213 RepID=A0A2P6MJM5_ALKUR|nr:hypothetical protein [Alkalicoccus urumqiensis]PRO66486.1 hypothetical protein C6I21_03860 [Alkalicoccus urumqiensis]
MRTLRRGLTACMLLAVVTACSQTDGQTNDEEAQAANTESTSDEGEVTATTEEGDFEITLTSAKKVYQEGQSLDIAGLLTYKGQRENIELYHAAAPFNYVITDYERSHITFPEIETLGKTSTLAQGEALEINTFKLSEVGYPLGTQSEKEKEKMKETYGEADHFPAGVYTITLLVDFSYEKEGETTDVYLPTSIDIVVEPS